MDQRRSFTLRRALPRSTARHIEIGIEAQLSPAMGSTSSQVAPSESQEVQQQPANTQDSMAQEHGEGSGKEIRVKKRRKDDEDANRPPKRSKKSRHSGDGVADSASKEEFAKSKGVGDESIRGSQEIVRKRSKKRSKEETQRKDGEGGLRSPLATQESFVSEGLPRSTAETANGGGSDKPAKKKKKRHTGRPSGLNLAPADLSEQATQETPSQETQQATPMNHNLRHDVDARSPSQSQTLTLSALRKSKDKGRKKRRSDQYSPEIAETQDTQHSSQDVTSPRSPTIQRSVPSAIESTDEVQPTPSTPKSKTSSKAKKQTPEREKVNGARTLPTPPDASQLAVREPTSPNTARGDRGGRHDDHSKVVPKRKKSAPSKAAVAEEIEESPAQVSSPQRSKKRKSASGGDDKEYLETNPSESDVPSQQNSNRKRRSKKPVDGEAEKIDSAADEDVEPSKNNKKRKKKSAPTKAQLADGSDASVAKGPFTEAEKAKVDEIYNEMLQDSGMTESDFRASLKTWKDATDFKMAVESALPARPKPAIRKFCQRRYHNLERGAWSPEDDESLRRAFAVHGPRWTEVSALVGRFPADCKDRWQKHVSIEGTLQVGAWTQEEEEALTKAVEQALKDLKKANKGNKDFPTSRDEQEQMINWAQISNELGNTRSFKRCNEKWQKLKKRLRAAGADGTGNAARVHVVPLEGSKRLAAAARLYDRCDVGDLFDILTEIHTAIPNHSQNFDLETTFWSMVSTKNPDSRFSSSMRIVALRDAESVYGNDVTPQPTYAATAKALADHLEEQWGLEALSEKRTFEKRVKARKDKATEFKSREHVEDDEEASDE